MAENNQSGLFKRLQRLFSTDVIIRNVGGNQLKVVDTDAIQSVGNLQSNSRVDRFQRMFGTGLTAYTGAGQILQATRLQLFRDYEAMDTDSIIASALDIYADECLHGDTIIPLLDGRKITIKELYDNKERDFWLYGLDEDNTFKPIQAQRVAHNGVKQIYAVTLDDGTVIKCTANHIWVTSTGEQVMIKDIQVGSSIYALPTKLSEGKNMKGYEQIWDKNEYEFTHRLVARKHKQLVDQKQKIAATNGNTNSLVLHHKSFNKTNNNPTQLQWMHWREHNKVHATFNKDLWNNINNNPQLLSDYKQKHAKGIKSFWAKDNTAFAKKRAQSLRAHYAGLSAAERADIYGHKGSSNGMYGRGHVVSGVNNGRYDHTLDRLEGIDVDKYLHTLTMLGSNNPQKAVQKEFNINRSEYLRINKTLCQTYGCNSIKQLINMLIAKQNTQFIKELRAFCRDSKLTKPHQRIRFKEFCESVNLTASQGRRVLLAAGYKTLTDLVESNNHRVISIEDAGYADVYDIVNAGDNHIYAVEAVDGSKIYTHNCTAKDEFDDTLTIVTTNEKIHTVLHNLFYDIMNVEFNLWPWVRNTLKYGDFYLHLHITEKFGITNVEPISPYEMMREEGTDPANPNKVVFKRDFAVGMMNTSTVYRNNVQEYDNYEIAHFRLLNDTNFLPYGRSLLEPARKVWKQVVLMEDAMLIHRIMRAPDKRIFKIDIGNIPPNEVDAFMEAMIAKMKKVPFVDQETGEYNLKYNMQNILEDFYLPVRGAESGTTIETTPGLQMDSIPDIEYLQNRLLGSLKIPKAYLGWAEDTSGKASLASQDFRFARTIERVQKIIVSELTKIAIIHLYAQGFTDEEIVDFSLKLTPPSTYYEREKLELWTSKATLAGDLVEKKLFSRFWCYEHIFNMQPEQWMEEQDRIANDAKEQFRIEQIKTEGNDPKKTGQSFGTPHDIASLYKGDGGVPQGYDEKAPKGGWPGAGRPKEPGTYETHDHPLGWDPSGAKQNRAAGKVTYEGQSIGKYKTMLETMSKTKAIRDTYTTNDDNYGLLNEENILDE